MIVELFGSPGSGKTYAINEIHPGTRVKNNTTLGAFKEVLKAFVKCLLKFTPYAIRVRHDILQVVKHGKYIYKYKPVKISSYINNISMLAAVYKYNKQDIFMDEGIIHRIIAMCINYDIDKSVTQQIIERINYTLEDVKELYLYLPVNECLKSIIQRNRHECSIDELQGEQLNSFLTEYFTYCEYISEKFNYKKITRDEIKNWQSYI